MLLNFIKIINNKTIIVKLYILMSALKPGPIN